MVKILDQTENGITYAWYCPECLSANVSEVFPESGILSCHVCSVSLVNVEGKWTTRALPDKTASRTPPDISE
jgi:hypothetical protein